MKVNKTFKISRVLGSMKKSVGTATTAGLSSVVGRWCKIFARATTIRCDDVACDTMKDDAKILRRNQHASRRVHQLLRMADRGVAKCVATSSCGDTWRRLQLAAKAENFLSPIPRFRGGVRLRGWVRSG